MKNMLATMNAHFEESLESSQPQPVAVLEGGGPPSFGGSTFWKTMNC